MGGRKRRVESARQRKIGGPYGGGVPLGSPCVVLGAVRVVGFVRASRGCRFGDGGMQVPLEWVGGGGLALTLSCLSSWALACE